MEQASNKPGPVNMNAEVFQRCTDGHSIPIDIQVVIERRTQHFHLIPHAFAETTSSFAVGPLRLSRKVSSGRSNGGGFLGNEFRSTLLRMFSQSEMVDESQRGSFHRGFQVHGG